jgi:hypothetical protein
MSLVIFLILAAYCMIKTAREVFILTAGRLGGVGARWRLVEIMGPLRLLINMALRRKARETLTAEL